jgi:hypothetical protein
MKRRGFLKSVGVTVVATLNAVEPESQMVTKEVDIGTDKALVNPMTGEVIVPADPNRTVEMTYEEISE